MKLLTNSILNSLIPQTCLVCERAIKANSKFCDWCRPDYYNINNKNLCDSCFLPLTSISRNGICPMCYYKPLTYKRVRYLWTYEYETRSYINKMKYLNSERLCKIAGHELANHFRDFIASNNFNLIIPMPSSKISLSKRLYFPTGIISREIIKINPNLRISYNSLNLDKKHKPQAELKLKERFKNAKQGWQVNCAKVEGRNILLIDDVITTGASLHYSSIELLKSGANSVSALALARAPRWLNYRFLLN